MKPDGRKWTSLSLRVERYERFMALADRLDSPNGDAALSVLLDYVESTGASDLMLASLDAEQRRIDERRAKILAGIPTDSAASAK